MTPPNNAIVAAYKSHLEAEAAVKELQKSDFDMRQLSIVGKDFRTDQHVTGFYNTGDRMKYWGGLGAFWGALWGFLFGSAFFFVPGIGPLVVAGPLVSWIVGALEGAVVVGGLSALGAGLCSIGLPKDSVLKYETAITTGRYLLVVHGTSLQIDQAREIIARTHPESMDQHELSVAELASV